MRSSRDSVWKVRQLDGRIALEFEMGSGFSHLIYLTSYPLDREAQTEELGLDQAEGVVFSSRVDAGGGREDFRITTKRVVDQLRDLSLKWPHVADPNRSGSEWQRLRSRPRERARQLRQDRQVGVQPNATEATDAEGE